MARQQLGQHFLADADWREQVARAIRVSRHTNLVGGLATADDGQSCWIEIGPGHGEMTGYLAHTGLPVHAIEVDPAMARSVVGIAKKFPNVEVIQADILQADLEAIRHGRRMKIYGSLPYYITSPILHRLFGFADTLEEIHVVVQTEVAERLAAVPGNKDYGYLSVATQFYTRPEIVLEIPRGAFRPPPEVSSTLVTMRLPGARAKLGLKCEKETTQAESEFLEFVKKCFAQKRKTLVNNLRGVAEAEQVRKALAQTGLKADARAEQVSIEQFAGLYKELSP